VILFSFGVILALKGGAIMDDKVRKNVYLSKENAEIAQEKCKELGIGFSSLVNLAVSRYCRLEHEMLINVYPDGRKEPL